MKVTKNGAKKLSTFTDRSYVERTMISKASKELFSNKRLVVSGVFSRSNQQEKLLLDVASELHYAKIWDDAMLEPNPAFSRMQLKRVFYRQVACLDRHEAVARLNVQDRMPVFFFNVAITHNPEVSDYGKIMAILDIESNKRAQKNLFEVHFGKNYKTRIVEILNSRADWQSRTLPLSFLYCNLQLFNNDHRETTEMLDYVVLSNLKKLGDPAMKYSTYDGEKLKLDLSRVVQHSSVAWWEMKKVFKPADLTRTYNWEIKQKIRRVLFGMYLETSVPSSDIYPQVFSQSIEQDSLYKDFGQAYIATIKLS